jgi:predicted DNA-binding transcriptional regulator AlpA
MENTVFYSEDYFTFRIDEKTFEFANLSKDSGTTGWAQIKVLENGELVKDEKERDTGRQIVWDDGIDGFIRDKFFALEISSNIKELLADELLSTNDVSELLGVSKTCVFKYVKEGKFSPVRAYKGGHWFTKSEITEWVNGRIQELNALVVKIENYGRN